MDLERFSCFSAKVGAGYLGLGTEPVFNGVAYLFGNHLGLALGASYTEARGQDAGVQLVSSVGFRWSPPTRFNDVNDNAH